MVYLHISNILTRGYVLPVDLHVDSWISITFQFFLDTFPGENGAYVAFRLINETYAKINQIRYSIDNRVLVFLTKGKTSSFTTLAGRSINTLI